MKYEYDDRTVWLEEGKRHRISHPAVIWKNGKKAYYQHGELDRIDGPAVIGVDGYKAWYIHGKKLSKIEFEMYHFVNTL